MDKPHPNPTGYLRQLGAYTERKHTILSQFEIWSGGL
jgi:hypothetical protein